MKSAKILLLVLLATLTAGTCLAQNEDKKPRIKSIIVLEEKNDVMIKKEMKESETYYDEKGNILEEISYKDGKVDKHFRYKYDAGGNKILEEEFDPSGRLKEYSEYRIENGLRVEKKVFDANKKLKSRKIYQYTTF
ncbi:MAG: hypothetical protein MUD02_03375 [Bacteroidales bacterium]|jgi:antitoxin component YwqK of YwqJK toxin-antitoxin module|nr:hypothetical protein [Bacteroidales bacterium]MCU0407969.1 hypothetical protein [Bacteroidales bacterium]